LKDTHYVISGSKDGHVKFWDVDTYQLIADLDDNILEVRTLVAAPAADFIVGGGLDGGFRVWRQSGDQTVAGDQEEKNAEKVLI
jgi:WD40 repeat protein